MTPSRMLRPALVGLIGLTTASCGVSATDSHRFETLAHSVATIQLGSASHSPSGSSQTATQSGLRPAQPMRVQVMDPHDMWDARDARSDGMRAAFVNAAAEAAPAMIEATAPAVREAVIHQVSERIARVVPTARTPSVSDQAHRPNAQAKAADLRPVQASPNRTLIQLGAYSSQEGARAAWQTVSTGSARKVLVGLSPVYETIQVNGRPYTRLKVQAPLTSAAAICRAAEVTDPWCARRA